MPKKILVKPRYSINPRNNQLYSYLDSKCIIEELSLRSIVLGADILHIHWPDRIFKWKLSPAISLFLLRMLLAFAKYRKIKIIYTFHNPKPRLTRISHKRYLENYYKLLDNFVDGMIVLSIENHKFANSVIPTPTKKIIPLGIQDVEIYDREDSFKYKEYVNEPYFFVPGLQESTKKTEIVISSILKYLKEDLNILIIGHFPDHKYLDFLRRQFAFEPRIKIFNDRLSDKDFYHLASDSVAIIVSQHLAINSGVATYAIATNKPFITDSDFLIESISSQYSCTSAFHVKSVQNIELLKSYENTKIDKFRMKNIANLTYDFYEEIGDC
jgi:glycosyltransferase involved in cell wall biosynthesis